MPCLVVSVCETEKEREEDLGDDASEKWPHVTFTMVTLPIITEPFPVFHL